MSRFVPMTVTAIDRTSRDAVVLSLAASDLSPNWSFRAGQYLTFRQTFDGEEIRRSYSICAPESAAQLRVGVKRVDGGAFSTFANERLAVGDTLEAMPPEGRFGDLPAGVGGTHMLGVAAGSGITPVLSILSTHLEAAFEHRFTLIYGNRSSSSIMFREELEDLKNRYLGRLNLVHVLSRERQEIELFNGRLDASKCASLFESWVDLRSVAAAFVCGPEAMMQVVREALLARGLAAAQIRLEMFAPDGAASRARATERQRREAQPATRERTAEVHIDGRVLEFPVAAGTETLLDAGLRAGVELPYSCKGGVCSTCMARVVEGEVEMDANFALEDYELARGYVLCCQSYPLSERVVVEYAHAL
ncbi:MAG: 2Fe-2S iron-sulfur cluster-binding protein [Pseudomonadota bacterium]